jgi:hypothetical protein
MFTKMFTLFIIQLQCRYDVTETSQATIWQCGAVLTFFEVGLVSYLWIQGGVKCVQANLR